MNGDRNGNGKSTHPALHIVKAMPTIRSASAQEQHNPMSGKTRRVMRRERERNECINYP